MRVLRLLGALLAGLTGDSVDYQPYQEVAAQYPAIPVADFQRAVQYIAPDGHHASAAEASFLTLSHARGKGFWLALYAKLPGFAAVAELVYAFIAAHRPAFYRISLVLWGRNYEPPRYDLVSFLFLRLFGLIYLSAFVSFGVQAQGLIGSHGILPLAELVDAVASRFGAERFFLMPMVFWWNDSDFAIQAVCWAGAGLSLLLVLQSAAAPQPVAALCALSLAALCRAGLHDLPVGHVPAGGGFLALLLSFATTPGIWLLRWLLFRFMFMSGVVKLLSGDPNWWNLSALSYHFLTQPLPTPLAWYAAQLPPGVLKVATGGTFFIELVLPFLIFCPRRLRFLRRLRHPAAADLHFAHRQLQLVQSADHAAVPAAVRRRGAANDIAAAPDRRLLPVRAARSVRRAGRFRSSSAHWRCCIVFCSLVQMDARFGGSPPAVAQAIDRLVEPLHIVSTYGLFAVMTTKRDEIVIEGSDDGVDWRDYEFRYKPGDVARRPRWNIPHQPRLDWQMWFAALEDPRRLPWFWRFLQRLLENEPGGDGAAGNEPLSGQAAACMCAREFYDYTYASGAEKAKGMWWDRRLLGLYFPAVRLKGDADEPVR